MADVAEARVTELLGEGLLVGELLDALDQVLVRRGVVGDLRQRKWLATLSPATLSYA